MLKSADDSISIATTGLDQKIKIWDLRIDCEESGIAGITIKKVQTVSTPVADVSDMVLLDERPGESAIIIGGVGLDVWRYDTTRKE